MKVGRSGQDLMVELQQRMSNLDMTLAKLDERGRVAAHAEQKYRVGLAQKIMLERDKGTPVTIINDLCRGDQEVAKLRFERDVAKTVYESAKEACNVYKLQIRVLVGQIDREFRG